MATYPRIDSPCPLRFGSMPGAEGFDCSQCHRHVHNLSAMTESARSEFLAGCDDSVCVAYSVPRAHSHAATAWVLAATVGVMSGAAMAQSNPPATLDQALAQMSGKTSSDANASKGQSGFEELILVGGVSNPRHAERVDVNAQRVPELPVVVEDHDQSPAIKTGGAADVSK